MLKQKIIKIDNLIIKAEKVFVITSVLLMLFLSFFQVLLRIFFNSGISWLDIFLRHIVMISALFSASMVSYYSSHFKIEIFEKMGIKENTKKILSSLSSIITIIAILIILVSSIRFILIEFNIRELANISSGHLNLFLPVIFFNMLIHSIALFFKEEKK